jgi:hypothetical protein
MGSTAWILANRLSKIPPRLKPKWWPTLYYSSGVMSSYYVTASCLSLQPSERVRVEIVSLSLRPESRAAADCSVVRLFVEYSLLDMPSEETPLSLPKPSPGMTSHYNHSNGKGIPESAYTHTHKCWTLIGEDGFVVMAGAEFVEWPQIHQTHGFHAFDAIPFTFFPPFFSFFPRINHGQ